MKSKNIHIIVQARSESTRMKNKLFRKIKNKSIVKIIYERLIKVKLADKIIFAVPKNKFNTNLKKLIRSAGAKYIFEGNNENVLSRYFETANYFKSDIINISQKKYENIYKNFNSFHNDSDLSKICNDKILKNVKNIEKDLYSHKKKIIHYSFIKEFRICGSLFGIEFTTRENATKYFRDLWKMVY